MLLVRIFNRLKSGLLHHCQRRKLRHFQQIDQMNCGPTCLRMVWDYFGIHVSPYEADQFAEKTRSGVTLASIVTAAQKKGIVANAVRCNVNFLKTSNNPILLHWRGNHYVLCQYIRKNYFKIFDPAAVRPVVLSEQELLSSWIFSTEGDSEGIAVLFDAPPDTNHYTRDRKNSSSIAKTLVILLTPYRAQLFMIVSLIGISTILAMLSPILMRQSITNGVWEDNTKLILYLLLAQLISLFFQHSTEIFSSSKSYIVSAKFCRKILVHFFESFMSSSLAYIESKNTGDIIGRISDQHKLQRFISTHAVTIFFDILTILALSSVVYIYGDVVFYSLFVGILLGFSCFFLLIKRVSRANYERYTFSDRSRNIELEMILGFSDLKTTNSGKTILKEWNRRQSRLENSTLKAVHYEKLQSTLTLFFFRASSTIVIYQMILGITTEKYSFAEFIAVSISVSFIVNSLNNIINFIQRGEDAWVSAFRLLSLDHSNEAIETKLISPPKDVPMQFEGIQLINVSFWYPGAEDRHTLKNISLTIKKGSTVAIVGKSGSGKSTLLKVLMLLYEPCSGNILLNGADMMQCSLDAWKERCGTVLQDGFLFSDTIENNITMSFGMTETQNERFTFAVTTAKLTDFIDQLPLGAKTIVGREGFMPSSGQVQRILIARALYTNPEYLFLDEATSSLDASTEGEIVTNLQHATQGITKIVVAHRLSTIINSDLIVMIRDGSIVEQGSHEELLELRGYYYSLVSDQMLLTSKDSVS
ncbi:peptidase domain-containing ABC transporter [Pseudovibrio sp. Ad26]|uniref:peptidase domain-containing ABC transporter n=1 Tax=Pseudovibrio sp. Ad26 TaxID=989410 RepID=UPI0023B8DD4D|nr:peptidase domain-containing ABC transporter [Pseudovibrio sp. Ad26]